MFTEAAAPHSWPILRILDHLTHVELIARLVEEMAQLKSQRAD
jgi:hypothetical protein